MITATFYKIRNGKYVTLLTWEKLLQGYGRIATEEEFLAFHAEYGKAHYWAFSERG